MRNSSISWKTLALKTVKEKEQGDDDDDEVVTDYVDEAQSRTARANDERRQAEGKKRKQNQKKEKEEKIGLAARNISDKWISSSRHRSTKISSSDKLLRDFFSSLIFPSFASAVQNEIRPEHLQTIQTMTLMTSRCFTFDLNERNRSETSSVLV